MNGLKRSLRRPTNSDNIMMASQQGRLASRNATYRDSLPAPRRAPTAAASPAEDPLAAYTRAIAAAGQRHGVQDDTVSKRALRRHV